METQITLSEYIDLYHSMGLNLIPIYDSDRPGHPRKTPCVVWKKYQSEKLPVEKLHDLLQKFDTNGIAFVCGNISDRLEVIDIDSKFKPGIEARLFSDIQSFYPHLWDILRIHRSPSGGYHILYKITQDVPGSTKLAGRLAYPEELAVKPDEKVKNFIETKANASIALAPPSVGYTIHKDNPIPVISWEDRCSLISLCQSYTELVKKVAPPKSEKFREEIYTTNPWEDFNNKFEDPTELMESYGWAFLNENSQFYYYTRPGKDTGVSASWNKAERYFYVFTSSTDAEVKGYNPAMMRGLLQYENDFKTMYRDLKNEGFGKFKPEYEFTAIDRALVTGREIPDNFSEAAKEKYQDLKAKRSEIFPFGEFLKYNVKLEKFEVSRESLYRVAKGLGFRLYEGSLYRIIGFKVHRVTEREFYDGLKGYIKDDDENRYVLMCNAFESFMQTAGVYTAKRIAELEEDMLLKDTPKECYKFYNNGYLVIDKDGYTLESYEDFTGLVWADKVQDRDFAEFDGGRYVEFINLALTKPKEAEIVLGYLAHDYKDETTGYAVILCEECENPKLGGGSGKNVLCNLFKLTTTYVSKPASQTKLDEKFFQSWSGQRIMGVSDTPKDYDFKFFKEPVTGDIIHKKLYKDETPVAVDRTPKFIFQTNYSYDNTDGGLARRMIPVEFTSFFTKLGGVDVHFGVHFPKQWSKEDYNGFDTFTAKCISKWIRAGLKIKTPDLTQSGWIKQFRQAHGETATDIILYIWPKFSSQEFTSNEDFNEMLTEFYTENGIRDNYHVSTKKLNDAIDVYAEKFGFTYVKSEVRKVDNFSVRGKVLISHDF